MSRTLEQTPRQSRRGAPAGQPAESAGWRPQNGASLSILLQFLELDLSDFPLKPELDSGDRPAGLQRHFHADRGVRLQIPGQQVSVQADRMHSRLNVSEREDSVLQRGRHFVVHVNRRARHPLLLTPLAVAVLIDVDGAPNGVHRGHREVELTLYAPPAVELIE